MKIKTQTKFILELENDELDMFHYTILQARGQLIENNDEFSNECMSICNSIIDILENMKIGKDL